jgi:drug/metabolite transporter (DMT)-like permease
VPSLLASAPRRTRPQTTVTAALVLVTAIWGITFVQVKDAVVLYPLFAFTAVRFAIASAALALPAAPAIRTLGRRGLLAGVALGLLLGSGFVLQTAGLQRTTVSSTGFITGLYVVLTPIFALVLFRERIERAVWAGVATSLAGLALLAGVPAGSVAGDLLVLASTAAQALQIVLLERFAARYDPIALVFVQMVTVCAACTAIAVALGEFALPRGSTVWGALLVTGLFASALAYLVQAWAQQRISATRIALLFSLETVFAGLFGYVLAGDRLGLAGWSGCALILAGIVLAEPGAASAAARLAPHRRS